jgi:hypothetical protein
MPLKSWKTILVSSLALFLAGPASAGIMVETRNFIASPTNFNGFECVGGCTTSNGYYTESGIPVGHLPAGSSAGIYAYSDFRSPFTNGQGNNLWYGGGQIGYESILAASGFSFSAVQFLVGGGYPSSVHNYLNYELLNEGSVVDKGSMAITSNSMQYVGFSGGGFNQVLIQDSDTINSFDKRTIDALALDAISAITAPVPEPSTWTMMILGFCSLGFVYRRKYGRSLRLA